MCLDDMGEVSGQQPGEKNAVLELAKALRDTAREEHVEMTTGLHAYPVWYDRALRTASSNGGLTCLALGFCHEASGHLSSLERDQELACFARSRTRTVMDSVGFWDPGLILLALPGNLLGAGMVVGRRLLDIWRERGLRGPDGSVQPICIGMAATDELCGNLKPLLESAREALQRAQSRGPWMLEYHGHGQPGEIQTITRPHFWEALRASCPNLIKLYGNPCVQKALDRLDRYKEPPYNMCDSRAWTVADSAALLAKKAACSADEQASIAAAALLRDVGMWLVPLPLVSRAGPLSTHDWELINAHPERSVRMIEDLELSSSSLDDVAYHHERMDGRGYPGRKKGRWIPQGARIIAVVDAYHAMRWPRGYKNLRSEEQARDELSLSAGSQFDPELVRCFLGH